MSKPVSPTRVLVVDADEAARTTLRRRFVRLGWEVMEAADAAKALSLIAMIPFDLAVVDLQTPGPDGADGLELVRCMRETRAPEELPILAVADEPAGEEAILALGLGADDCMARPLDIEAVHTRAAMHLRRRRDASAGELARRELQVRLEKLKDAVAHAEATAIILHGLGHDVRAPLNGLIGSASVLTKICQTPELESAIGRIETAVAALDTLMVAALGRTDRRTRAPKPKLRVLSADDDAGSRFAMRNLLHAAETEIELIEVATGLQAAVAAEDLFFDLILVNVATGEAIAGIRAIRRAERQNKTRRTPILAIGAGRVTAAQVLDAGADLHMRLPVTAERLLAALAEALGRESEDLAAVA
jgi:DNA-binding response OmpR family regulator